MPTRTRPSLWNLVVNLVFVAVVIWFLLIAGQMLGGVGAVELSILMLLGLIAMGFVIRRWSRRRRTSIE